MNLRLSDEETEALRRRAEAEKAAVLMPSLARDHPLVDGDERLACSATRVCCLLDGSDLVMDVGDAERVVLAVAAGDLDAGELTGVIGRHLG